jgi:glucan phosphoethanolaminetransferase (alkaline phosphatase superfamily)
LNQQSLNILIPVILDMQPNILLDKKEKYSTVAGFIAFFLLHSLPIAFFNIWIWYYISKLRVMPELIRFFQFVDKYPSYVYLSLWILVTSIITIIVLVIRNRVRISRFWRWYLLFYIILLMGALYAFFSIYYAQSDIIEYAKTSVEEVKVLVNEVNLSKLRS